MGQLDPKYKQIGEAMGLQGGFPPFFKLLGVKYEMLDGGNLSIRISMREELQGSSDGPLHGGVVASMLDIIGGTVTALGIRQDIENLPPEEQARKMKSVSTIDLRVDYLRSAKGQAFTATGSLLRSGRKLAVARMELRNEEDILIAVGTGTYTTV